jgi:hypothetical protein
MQRFERQLSMKKNLALVLLNLLLVMPVWAGPVANADAPRLRGDRAIEMAVSPPTSSGEVWALDPLLVRAPRDWWGARGMLQPPLVYAERAHSRGDYAAELEITRPLAFAGEAWARAFLGTSYFLGTGVTQSYAEALKWYRLAAEQGCGHAQFNLGFMYQTGEGVTQDDAEALKWYRLASALAVARSNLGVIYAVGRGVTQEYAKAYKLFVLGGSTENRDLAARSMTTEQIADAQKMALECKERRDKECF